MTNERLEEIAKFNPFSSALVGQIPNFAESKEMAAELLELRKQLEWHSAKNDPPSPYEVVILSGPKEGPFSSRPPRQSTAWIDSEGKWWRWTFNGKKCEVKIADDYFWRAWVYPEVKE